VIDMATSELVERSTYDAFGNDESDYRSTRWENFRESFRFTGKEYDAQVGLHYFGARYYSAHLGRWLSPDPLAIHGLGADLNPYAYVHGNVLSSVDPFGLDDIGGPGVEGPGTVTFPGDKISVITLPEMVITAAPPFQPDQSVPSAVTAAEHYGNPEAADLLEFARGVAQQPSQHPYSDGANEVGRQLGQNLALEATGAIVLKGVPWLLDTVPTLRTLLADTTGSLRIGRIANGLAPSSKALAAAMEAAGVTGGAGKAAHHIVAGSAEAAAPARQVLTRFGIGINDAANGVFLPGNLATENAAGAAVHSTIHTSAYYDTVNTMLGAATTRAEALDALGSIRQSLLGGGL
jgi:RHS repeat-associated protein